MFQELQLSLEPSLSYTSSAGPESVLYWSVHHNNLSIVEQTSMCAASLFTLSQSFTALDSVLHLCVLCVLSGVLAGGWQLALINVLIMH